MSVILQKVSPTEIEQRSMEIITAEMGEHNIPPEVLPIVKRVIHTTADFGYQQSLVFSPHVVEESVAVLRSGCTIVTDTQMVRSGINKAVVEKFGGNVVCFMSEPDVAAEAKKRGETRATVSMERAAQIKGNVIFALGNAPTAVVRLCQLAEQGLVKPSLVIGVPVGFVNVVESKELLLQSNLPHIVAKGRKGGSNIAAAICNGLLYIASDNDRG